MLLLLSLSILRPIWTLLITPLWQMHVHQLVSRDGSDGFMPPLGNKWLVDCLLIEIGGGDWVIGSGRRCFKLLGSQEAWSGDECNAEWLVAQEGGRLEAFSCLHFCHLLPAGRPTKSWILLRSVFASSPTTICTLLPTDSLPFSTDDLLFDRIIWLSSRSPHYQKNFPNGSYLAQKKKHYTRSNNCYNLEHLSGFAS